MSRKNLLPDLSEEADAPALQKRAAPAPSVKLFGAAMDEMRGKVERAREIEKELADAQRVVEIEPSLIDPSPVRDRLPDDGAEDERLRASIAATGQQIPVLVRRAADGARFVTVFGHRRIAAARSLERAVRAVVVEMSDEDALVAQGVENAERKNLTFIERVLFAERLSRQGVPQTRIAVALAAAPPHVSEMIRIARSVPADLIAAIGRAPRLGRPRWLGLAARLSEQGPANPPRWKAAVGHPDFADDDEEGRMRRVMAALAASPRPAALVEGAVLDHHGARIGTASVTATGALRIEIGKATAQSVRADGVTFATWLATRLADLKEDWANGNLPSGKSQAP